MLGGLAGLGGAALVSILLPLIFKLMCLFFEPFKPYADTMPALWTFIPMGLFAGFAFRWEKGGCEFVSLGFCRVGYGR